MPLNLLADDPDKRRAATALAVLVEQAFRRSESTDNSPMANAVLRVIAQFGDAGISSPDLGATFNAPISTIDNTLKRLASDGFITWDFPPESRAKKLACITTEGLRVLEQDPFELALSELFDRVEPADIRRLFDILIRTDSAQQRWRTLKFGFEFWR